MFLEMKKIYFANTYCFSGAEENQNLKDWITPPVKFSFLHDFMLSIGYNVPPAPHIWFTSMRYVARLA